MGILRTEQRPSSFPNGIDCTAVRCSIKDPLNNQCRDTRSTSKREGGREIRWAQEDQGYQGHSVSLTEGRKEGREGGSGIHWANNNGKGNVMDDFALARPTDETDGQDDAAHLPSPKK